jgi:hypothetical protein
MYSHIKRLRVDGQRKADRDISADPGAIGHVSVFRQGSEIVAAAYATGGTGQPGQILPLLYRARLVTMQGQGMLFQGWERPHGHDQPDTDRNKLEWSVKMLTEAPAVPPPSERLG